MRAVSCERPPHRFGAHPEDPFGQRGRREAHRATACLGCCALRGTDPEFLQALISTDPRLVLSETIGVAPAMRPAVVEALLRAYDEGRIPRGPIFPEQFKVLCHDELGAQLRPYVSTGHDDRAREIAVDVAAACSVTELVPDLLELALSGDNRAFVRIGAAHTVATIGVGDERARLADLLDLDAVEDPQDELKGCALMALWPDLINAQRLFAALTRPKVENLYGLYAAFLRGDPMASLEADGLVAALDWVVRSEWAIAALGAGPDLADKVLARATRLSGAAPVEKRLATTLVEISERVLMAGALPPCQPSGKRFGRMCRGGDGSRQACSMPRSEAARTRSRC